MNRDKHILIAEDEEADVALVRLALEEKSIHDGEIVVTRDGAEALDYLFRRGRYQARAPGNPGLIILDLKLPKINGLEVLRQIRAEDSMKDVPVVIFSSSLHEKDKHEAIRCGADTFIVKPMDLETFSSRIHSMLNLYV